MAGDLSLKLARISATDSARRKVKSSWIDVEKLSALHFTILF